MLIEVTAEDIQKGKKSSPTGCPVARALRRATKTKYFVSIFDATNTSGKEIWFEESVQNFIFDFDLGREVFPMNFEIED